MNAEVIEAPKKKKGIPLLGGLAVFCFLVLLFTGQVATGTRPDFALLVSTFIIVGAWSIKILGGPFTLPGASVSVLMLQHVVISQVAKVFMNQSASDPLLNPMETMKVYNLAILAICAASYAFRAIRVDKIRPLFGFVTDVSTLRIMTAILSVFAIFRFVMLQKFGVYEGGGVYVGGFVGPLRQLGFVTLLAIACGTAYMILKSDGKRCLGGWNTITIVATTLFGILGAGRQEAASSVVTFVLTLIAFKFKFKAQHFGFAILIALVFLRIIFPYSLYARGEGGVREGTLEKRIQKASEILVDVALDPGKYKKKETTIDPHQSWYVQRMYYYGRPISTLDRYSVIISTDNIVHAVLQRGPAGWKNATAGFGMLLPRFLNPEKEALGSSNTLAHYGDGLVGDTDFMTQITLGMIPEGFYSAAWIGVPIALFVVSFLYFSVYRMLYYKTMFNNVFVLSQIFTITWSFSESTLQGQTLNILQTPVYYIAVVYPVMLFAKSMTKKTREAPFIFASPHDSDENSPGIQTDFANPPQPSASQNA